MSHEISAREAILSSIRGAYPAQTDEDAARAYAGIGRAYQRKGELPGEERLRLFEERLREYDAGVYRASQSDACTVIAKVLAGRGLRRMVIPRGTPESWLPEGFSCTVADDLEAVDLDRMDGVLSGCTVAIAFTGTIVLQNLRRLTLVPDYHLCVVLGEQVVETVPEAFDALQATSTLPTTFVSGPSATADIEMTRIRGVHGPRRMDVVLVV